ncbi:MAG: aspartate/glutamate racemase family protein, partial [Erysipelotrichaceae bacterium]|nr:aspartate/glutamate racemase family protein [Erysipelotrichaceae bacterium]
TSFVCIADQANAPYGEKSVEQLEELARKHLLWFKERNIYTVLVACNTLCSTVVKKLQNEFDDMQIIDIVSLTCDSLKNESFSNLLLLATKRSIESKVYEDEIKNMLNCNVYSVIPNSWVPSIENQASEEELDRVVKDVVLDYKDKVDAVLLGCTHYPLLKKYISKYLDVKMYDSCDAILKSIPRENLENPRVSIYTSGDIYKTKQQILDTLGMNLDVFKL